MQRAVRKPAPGLGGYDLFLRANPLVEAFENEKDLTAIELLDRSVALDPGFGPALALCAACHSHYAARQPPEAAAPHRQLAAELAPRALAAGGDDAYVLALTADALATMNRDIEGPLSLCERAIDINPGLNWAWFESGWIRVRAGQPELGVEHLKRSMRLDPISPMQPFRLAWLGVARLEQRRFAEAVALLRQSAQLLPSYPVNPTMLTAAYGLLGDVEAAQRARARDMPRTQRQLEGYAAWAFREPEHRQLFLEGMAAARAGG